MPLSPPAEREHLHTRQIELQGYRRADGLWDIEGHLTDIKSYGFKNEFRGEIAAGEPIHDMWLRLTIDEDFVVREVEAVTDGSPFRICPQITPNFQKLIGARMTKGWHAEVQKRLGGIEGCTHLVEILGTMGTAAYQSLYPALAKKNKAHGGLGKPGIIDSCHAFAGDGEVVRKSWPKFYTGSES